MPRRRSLAPAVQISLLALSSCLALSTAIYYPRAFPGPPLRAISLLGVAPLITVMTLGPLMLSFPQGSGQRWLLAAGFTLSLLLPVVLLNGTGPAAAIADIFLPDLLR